MTDQIDSFMSLNHQVSACHCSFHRVTKQPDEKFLGHVISHCAESDDTRGVGYAVYPWAANGPLVSQRFWTKESAKEYVQRLHDEKERKAQRRRSSIIGVEPGDSL